MRRSPNSENVLRPSLGRIVISRGLLCLLAFGAACSDAPVDMGLGAAADGPSSRFVAGRLLDSAELRALSTRVVVVGERLMIAADSGAAESVSEQDVSVRDTTVAGIDSEGMLYALGAGQTWVTWSSARATDSSLMTVAESATDAQPTYVQPVAPKATVDVRYPTGRTRGSAKGKIVKIAAGGDLQAALSDAQPGDEIILASGATFTGNYVLPAKQSSSADWIIVRAEAVPVAAGTRMTPTSAQTAARIVTPDQNPAIRTANGARRWRLVGFQVEHAPTAIYNYGIVVLGRGDERTIEAQPSEIVLDRMYIHGSLNVGNSRCVALNGRSLAVIDSWLSECHAKGNDAQGICGWSGGGPFLIENNYIEGSGQAIMFGGADPAIANVSPSDITIRHNYLYKPLSWANGRWTIKATFELKHGKRVLFEGNVLENHWVDAQTGYAVLFQTVSDNNTSWPWVSVSDVMVRNNIIKNSASGATVAGWAAYNGGPPPSNPSTRVVFVNNLWQDVGVDPVSGAPGRIFMLLVDHRNLSLVNNTVTLKGRAFHALIMDGLPSSGTTIVNNVFPNSEYGFFGSGLGVGTNALRGFVPGAVVERNVIPGQQASLYPAENFFPAASLTTTATSSIGACLQVKTWLSNQSLPAGIGADCDALDLAVQNVVPPAN